MLNTFEETFEVTEMRTFKHEPFFIDGGAYSWYFTVHITYYMSSCSSALIHIVYHYISHAINSSLIVTLTSAYMLQKLKPKVVIILTESCSNGDYISNGYIGGDRPGATSHVLVVTSFISW